MVDESDSKWVYVKSLAGAKNQPRPVRSKLVYHWIDENNHEPFDSSKFEKGNNFCMYFGGTAVRHAAYAFADSKEELMAKMLKQKGNITLRAATVPPRRALTPIQGSSLKGIASNVFKTVKQKVNPKRKPKSKPDKSHPDKKRMNDETSDESGEIISKKPKTDLEPLDESGDPPSQASEKDQGTELVQVLDQEGDQEGDQELDLDQDLDQELHALGSGMKNRSTIRSKISTPSTPILGKKCTASNLVFGTGCTVPTPVVSKILASTPARQDELTNLETVESRLKKLEFDVASCVLKLETIGNDISEIKETQRKILDVVMMIQKSSRKCRIANLARAVDGYDETDVPEDQVLIGMVEGELKFLTKTSLCQVEKNNADLKNRILQLGQLYYGEEYFNYSLTGKKSGKTVIHKIEPEHLVGIAKILQCFKWIKAEDTSVERINRVVGKYFSSERSIHNNKKQAEALRDFDLQQTQTGADSE